MRYGETAAAKSLDEMVASRGAGEGELMEGIHPPGVARERAECGCAIFRVELAVDTIIMRSRG
jgi:hypothetical protein